MEMGIFTTPNHIFFLVMEVRFNPPITVKSTETLVIKIKNGKLVSAKAKVRRKK